MEFHQKEILDAKLVRHVAIRLVQNVVTQLYDCVVK